MATMTTQPVGGVMPLPKGINVPYGGDPRQFGTSLSGDLGQQLDPATIQQLMQLSNQQQFPWSQLGYSAPDKMDAISKAYLSNFQRLPTQQEVDIAMPQFQGPNGNAWVAAQAQQQQALQQAPQQEQQQIQQQIPIIQNLINQQMQGQVKNMTDPNSPGYQQFAAGMENQGISPSSGAFQAGLGGAIGQENANLTTQALGQIGMPLAQGYSQGMMQPFQQSVQQPYQLQQQGYDWQNFMEQERLAKQMGSSGGSGMWGDMLSGGLQGAAAGGAKGGPWGAVAGGGAGAGAGYAKSTGTWICTAMREAGVMTVFEVQKLHYHLFRAFSKRPFKFIGYILFGKLLVLLANSVGTHWGTWKPEFYDKVIAESDPVIAVDLYGEAFWSLFKNVRATLSQRRVYGS